MAPAPIRMPLSRTWSAWLAVDVLARSMAGRAPIYAQAHSARRTGTAEPVRAAGGGRPGVGGDHPLWLRRLKQDLLPRAARATSPSGKFSGQRQFDLLALQTTAVRDGGRLCAQWPQDLNSHAGIGSYGLVIARTNPAPGTRA
jgi:hypothetical protein